VLSFGEQQQPEPPPVEYDPSNADRQSFMATLLFGEGEAWQRFEQHQAQLEQELIDRNVDAGVYPIFQSVSGRTYPSVRMYV